MTQLAGFLAAAIAVVCFGTNFIPVKKYDTGDGMFFQWCMCVGIFVSGFFAQLYTMAKFEPIAAIGGVLWCTGNITAVPVIQCIGLGLGMLIWGGTALVVGWACSFFGWLGDEAESDEVYVKWLNYMGVGFALLSLLVFSQVKSGAPEVVVRDEDEESDIDDPARLTQSANDTYESGLLQHGVHVQNDSSIEYASDSDSDSVILKPASSSWTDALSPTMKRAVGIGGAVFAGCMYGTNFNPPQWLMDNPYRACPDNKGVPEDRCAHSTVGYDYIFSHFSGILMASTFYFLLYCIYSRNRPWLSAEIALPSFLSGSVWSFAQMAWFVANTNLSLVISFPIISTAPGVVASLVGIVLYKEIQGTKNFIILGGAILLTITGCICIALSKMLNQPATPTPPSM